MREIKFKAWDSACNCMIDSNSPSVRLMFNGSVSIDSTWATRDLTLIQYTGLKDKNSVDIYEGDIVIDEDGVYLLTQIGGYMSKHGAGYGVHYCVNGDKNRFVIDASPFEIEKKLKVTGNIYENPDLLEK